MAWTSATTSSGTAEIRETVPSDTILSLLAAVLFLVAKVLFWNSFQVGVAPLLIGIFFFGAVQMLFIGLLGEYIGSIHTKVRNMPLVIEAERVNFDL